MKTSVWFRLAASVAVATGTAAVAAPTSDLSLIAAAIRSGRLIQAELMIARTSPSAESPAVELDVLRAQLALAQGRDQDARRGFAALASNLPDDCRILVGGGVADSNLGNADAAIGRLERAVTLCDPDWRAWSALGAAYDVKQRWLDSGHAYAKAMEVGGVRPGLLNDAATSLIKQRRFEEAEKLLIRAIADAPDDERIANNIDIAAGSLGRMPVRRPSDSASRWAERLNNAGYAAMLEGRTDDARRWLTQSLIADPIYQSVAAANLAKLDTLK
ncbi:hypothetical protein FPZ24_15185 [Sphingomonas panacisoli]|uniref:Uncharacterized protein n=1 Tax=Sphingomonas panacisoli TaxID=1813879 RepID=A0A5B8LKG4_9SPHN|nr:hypothetical protein [Sphingomonas panacisoli]QDZ08643.1 hypothetical protein FPZ24_15185 [Sphingomonas panacisoli]